MTPMHERADITSIDILQTPEFCADRLADVQRDVLCAGGVNRIIFAVILRLTERQEACYDRIP